MAGAAGEIGGELTRRLPDELARARSGGGYELVAADRRPLSPEVARGFDGTVVDLEITDLDRYTEACAGIDTVVHLAGERRTTAAWESLLPANVLGAYPRVRGSPARRMPPRRVRKQRARGRWLPARRADPLRHGDGARQPVRRDQGLG